MPTKTRKRVTALLVALAVGGLAYLIVVRSAEEEGPNRRDRVAAVAVGPVERRPIELRRVFSGALEARSQFIVAPKVSGRVDSVAVDIGDSVRRGQTVAVLDSAEFAQAVNQAEAELAVARANLAEAESALQITQRENQRTVTLRERGIASESEFDTAQAALLARQAQVEVAAAQVERAKSALESARIRLGYTRIEADWTEGDDERVVAERFVDEGQTVSANDPLLRIVELNPITAVINVTERDYGLLRRGMEAKFTTDAFPGKVFSGRVERISPVFRESSRQARVELSLENPEGHLKPGMFVRSDIALRREAEATVIPYSALTRRGDEQGVYVVNPAGDKVSWQPVQTGIRSGEWIQVIDGDLGGRVVTLGQHLIDDGSPIVIPETKPFEVAR